MPKLTAHDRQERGDRFIKGRVQNLRKLIISLKDGNYQLLDQTDNDDLSEMLNIADRMLDRYKHVTIPEK